MFGLVGSITGSKPSPKTVMNQSLLRMPWTLLVRDGPPWVALSWVPP